MKHHLNAKGLISNIHVILCIPDEKNMSRKYF